MNQYDYMKFFNTEKDALRWKDIKNNVNCNKKQHYVVIDGPENNFAVVDLRTAIEMDMPYRF